MKILAMGDFDGKLPKKYIDLVKKEKIDLVVCDGDYPPFSLRKEFFDYIFPSIFDIELWDVVGKKEYKEKTRADHIAGESVMKKLDKLSVPVLTVLGNHDYSIPDDVADFGKPEDAWKWDWNEKDFLVKALKKYKNIRRIDYKFAVFGDFVFIGARGHSFPGQVKSKAFRKHKKILDKLFKRFKGKKIIFVSHNSPYDTKLDKITSKEAHEIVKDKHYGSKLVRRVIDQHQPILSISGHVDEGWGKQKLGKTLAVNCGAVHDGRVAVIEISDKGKIDVRFIS